MGLKMQSEPALWVGEYQKAPKTKEKEREKWGNMPGGVGVYSTQRTPGLYLLQGKENSDHQGHWG